ncbi:MAG: methyltransferase domain-containing protein [Bacillota bacterium]|nr:methyltransferase domain-containing protein [Bacillota bacterium]
MRPYSFFARLYDRVMQAIPYAEWIEYVQAILERFDARPSSVADLACGTGNTTLPWARMGYRVYGVDRSPEMLEVARRKAEAERLEVTWVEADLRSFELPEPVELATCLYDSLNYLEDEEALEAAFRAAYRNLRPGGLLVMDMNTEYKLLHVEPETHYYRSDDPEEEWHLIWEHGTNMAEQVWEVRLTGFLPRPGHPGCYERLEEVHRERGYPAREVERRLARAGFRLLATYDAYTFDPPVPVSDRLFWVARRPGGSRRLARRA